MVINRIQAVEHSGQYTCGESSVVINRIQVVERTVASILMVKVGWSLTGFRLLNVLWPVYVR